MEAEQEWWSINECDRQREISTFVGAWSLVLAEALESWLKENLCCDSIRSGAR